MQKMRDRVMPLNRIAAHFLNGKCDACADCRSIAAFDEM